MAEAKVAIQLEIEIGPRSPVVGCVACLSVVQTAEEYNCCTKCTCVMCPKCVQRLPDTMCPTCRKGQMMRGGFVAREVYPRIVHPCPNEGCTLRVVAPGEHVKVCKFRAVPCPWCKIQCAAQRIHEHARGVCVITWTMYAVDKFAEMMRWLVGLQSGDASILIGGAISMMGRGDERVLYVWREPRAIRFMCVQLGGAEEEKVVCVLKSAADEDNTRRLSIRVANVETLTATVPVSVAMEDMMSYDVFELAPGAHTFVIGTVYMINVDGQGDWSRATLIEVLSGPSRGVFVTEDDRRKTVVIAIEGNVSRMVRPYDADDDQGLEGFLAVMRMALLHRALGGN